MREPDGPLTPTERVAFLDAAADLPQAGTGGGTEVPGPDHCFAALATGAPGRVQAGPFTFRLAAGELNRRVRATSPSERPRTVRRWMRAGTVWRVCVVAADRVRIGQPHWVEGAAVVLENHTGEVLAATGGRGMELEGFHRGTQAARQPGSSFKPVVYAAALQSGMTRRHTVLDAPLTIRGSERTWTPQNYGRTFSGPVRLEDAFARSLNTAAIRLVQRVGADAVVEEARALGYHSPMRADLSIALGTSEVTVLEQAVMVSTLVNGGRRRDPVFIREIQDASGTVWRAGDTVAHPALPSVVTLPGGPAAQVIPGAVARQVVDMMRGVVEHGTGRAAPLDGVPRIGKTGTTSDYADAWYIGATPRHTIAVWLGADDRTPLGDGETGGHAALPAWTTIATHLDGDGGQFPLPDGALLVRYGHGWASLPRDALGLRHLGGRPPTGPLPRFPGTP